MDFFGMDLSSWICSSSVHTNPSDSPKSNSFQREQPGPVHRERGEKKFQLSAFAGIFDGIFIGISESYAGENGGTKGVDNLRGKSEGWMRRQLRMPGIGVGAARGVEGLMLEDLSLALDPPRGFNSLPRGAGQQLPAPSSRFLSFFLRIPLAPGILICHLLSPSLPQHPEERGEARGELLSRAGSCGIAADPGAAQGEPGRARRG